MSLAYRLLYLAGITPWEKWADGPAAEQFRSLFERAEGAESRPGAALDLGCGSGIWAVELARRGWDVTGIDFVPRALRRARERAADAGVRLRLVAGDVTDLHSAGVGSGFELILDLGCFHDELSDAQREAEGREVTSAAAPGATLLIFAFERGRRGPLPRGASRTDVESAFPDWRIVEEERLETDGAPGWVRRAAPRLYALRRDPDQPARRASESA